MEKPDQEELKKLLQALISNSITDKEATRFSLLIDDPENREAVCKAIDFIREINNETGDVCHSVDFTSIYNKIVLLINPEERTATTVLRVNRRRFRALLIKVSSAAAIIIMAIWTGILSRRIIPVKQTADNETRHYNEIRTPLGSKTNMKLPDGSFVYLNSGSLIRYADNFNIKNRDISLEGEAYFTVAPNRNLPFIVIADSMSIMATGTEFNVKAYREDDYVEATLVKGKIEISQKGIADDSLDPLELQPRQKATYLKNKGKLKSSAGLHDYPVSEIQSAIKDQDLIITSSVDIDKIVSWTKNRFIFNNERLEDLSIEISRAHDVTISFGDEVIKEYRFTGTLDDNPIEQILTAIKLSSPVDYKIDGKNVTLFIDRNRQGIVR